MTTWQEVLRIRFRGGWMFPASPEQGRDGCPLVGSTKTGSTTDTVKIRPNLADNPEESSAQNETRSLFQQALSSLRTSKCLNFTYFDILVPLEGAVRELSNHLRGLLKKACPESFEGSASVVPCLRRRGFVQASGSSFGLTQDRF